MVLNGLKPMMRIILSMFFLRKGKSEEDVLMTVLNLTPRTFDYKIGIEEGTNGRLF